jgi:hypothetical protein
MGPLDFSNLQPQQPGLSPSVVVPQDPSQAWASLPPSPALAPAAPPEPVVTPDQIARLKAAVNPQPQAQPQPGSMPFSADQLRQAALASAQRYVPGQAAITPADIAQKQAWNDKGFVATQGSQARVGASPEAYEHLQKVQENQQEAILNQSIADKLQANANMDAAKANALAAQQMHEQEAYAQAQREEAWQQRYSEFQNKYNPENDRVDPNRFFKRAGVLGSIMAVIGAGFEASAAARRGTANPQTVMRLIDNDIRSQEADIRAKGASANNQLMQLSREWGSIENGKQALKSLQLQAAGAKAQYVAARTNDPAMKEQIDAHASMMLAQSEKEIAALKAQYGGQLNEQQQGVIMRPQAGRAGGMVTDRGKTFSNMIAANKAAGDAQELDIKRMEAGGKQSEKAQEHAQQAAKDLATLQEVRSSAEAYYQSIGLKRDERGEWIKPATSDNPLRGPWDTLRNTTTYTSSKEADVANANRALAIEAVGRWRSQGAINKEEDVRFQDQLSEGGDAAARANALERALSAKESSLRAGAGQAASQQFDRARASEGERRKAIITGDEQPYRGRTGG